MEQLAQILGARAVYDPDETLAVPFRLAGLCADKHEARDARVVPHPLELSSLDGMTIMFESLGSTHAPRRPRPWELRRRSYYSCLQIALGTAVKCPAHFSARPSLTRTFPRYGL